MNTDLKAKIANCPSITVITHGDIEVLSIAHAHFDAEVSLQGAQLLNFTPKEQKNWLWLSPLENFTQGKAIRGGVPVCLPWFGVSQSDTSKPKHGFARNQPWLLSQANERNDRCQLIFDFIYSGNNTELFPHAFNCQLTLSLSHEVDYQLSITNNSTSTMPLSFALHSYFSTDDLNKVEVAGLESKSYLDNTENLCPKLQKEAVTFTQEVDRVFENIDNTQLILQPQSLSINATSMPSCIVWNPGKQLASDISDIKNHYNEYLCVERGAAFANSLSLHANETQQFSMTIKRQSWP